MSYSNLKEFKALATHHDVPWVSIGEVGGQVFSFPPLTEIPLNTLTDSWSKGLENRLKTRDLPG